ncbi:MAG TPA: GtrA family protein [Nocardioides sp.]|uniref:GtrA family protein n=1 Tax=Nocardioides sp. TaxID=35761 RepID=UPI002E2F056B|nr:GtrA family protein [Nocardioides sp.]HEX3931417.1 GtrA family protein [Nocardioides sp.]
MSTTGTSTLRRHRGNALQFGRFALVGGTGVVVNLVVLIAVKRLGPGPEDAIAALPPTAFHIRWYHVYSTAAFLVANLWNFQLNRSWTFRSARHSRWWREYWPFLAVGMLGQAVGLVLLTLLMHRGSPLSLPTGVLDDSSGLRTRLYWAQLIVITVVTPLSFVLNKLWTFAAVRTHHLDAVPAHPAAGKELEHLGVDEGDAR